MRPARSFPAAFAAVCLALFLFIDRPAEARGGEGVEVFMIEGHIFSPEVVHARRGSKVVFRNRDKDLHALTLAGREDLLDEVYLEKGDEYILVMPGDMPPQTLELRCSIHIEMKAAIVIE